MKIIPYSFVLVTILLSGCQNWWVDDRPVPVTPPYQTKEQSRVKNEEEQVNRIISAISLRMAASGRGPYCIVPSKELGHFGYLIWNGLCAMKLSDPTGPVRLVLIETAEPVGKRIILRENEDIFFKSAVIP